MSNEWFSVTNNTPHDMTILLKFNCVERQEPMSLEIINDRMWIRPMRHHISLQTVSIAMAKPRRKWAYRLSGGHSLITSELLSSTIKNAMFSVL